MLPRAQRRKVQTPTTLNQKTNVLRWDKGGREVTVGCALERSTVFDSVQGWLLSPCVRLSLEERSTELCRTTPQTGHEPTTTVVETTVIPWPGLKNQRPLEIRIKLSDWIFKNWKMLSSFHETKSFTDSTALTIHHSIFLAFFLYIMQVGNVTKSQ